DARFTLAPQSAEGNPAPRQPGVQRASPDLQLSRQIADEPLVLPQGPPVLPRLCLAFRRVPGQEPLDDVLVEWSRPLDRAVALGVEVFGDLGTGASLRPQLLRPAEQALEIGHLLVALHGSHDLVGGPLSPDPGDAHLGSITDPLDGHLDPLDEETNDLLPV